MQECLFLASATTGGKEVVMAETSWQISGDYFESCSCAYLCPCIYTNMAAQPTKGSCTVALAFHVEHGQYGAIRSTI